MKRQEITALLAGGDRRSIGRADELVRILRREPDLLPRVMQEMWNPDPLIAMRAADAIEKLTRKQADALQRFKKELLGLAEETRQQELRWHLAAMIPRLQLSPAERRRAAGILNAYLNDRSSIAKTFALQGLFELSAQDSGLREQVIELLRAAAQNGTPAMRARARKLLAQMAGKGSG